MALRGIRSNASVSYVNMERAARAWRGMLFPGLSAGAPIPPGVWATFEELDRHTTGTSLRPIALDSSVTDLPVGVEGLTQYRPEAKTIEITLSTGTYTGLEEDEPRARFSLFHEVVHAFVHWPLLIKLSVLPHRELTAVFRQTEKTHRDFEDTEWQANAGAAAMLMPASGLERLRKCGPLSTSRVVDHFGVSRQSAEIRIRVFDQRREELVAA
jgi:hypothetical protein